MPSAVAKTGAGERLPVSVLVVNITTSRGNAPTHNHRRAPAFLRDSLGAIAASRRR
jgi:hypothetical protein